MSRKHTFLVVLSLITSVVYIGWRIIATLPFEYGIVSLIGGLLLVSAEGVGVLDGVLNYINMRQLKLPELPKAGPEDWVDVDILIATHNESVEVLYKTINACRYLDYPDQEKVHIHVCDDNDRPEMKELAESLGVGYIGLSGNKAAKAGNLNHALSLTHSPLVATFDADMIPRRSFLMATVPYFTLGNIGFIQTPQSFYNPDLFQYNFYAEANVPNEQDYFFQSINLGKNRTNSAIYAGSNTLISRKALMEAGGIVEGTITEDFATGIKIQELGYDTYAINRVLAHGLAPVDFRSLVKQRQRWGRGCVQTVRRAGFLFGPLPLQAKLSYIDAFSYWWTSFRRMVYILAPLLFALLGIVVVDTSLFQLLIFWLPSYIIYNQAFKILAGNNKNQNWSNIVDTIFFPYLVGPILLETLGIKLKKFAVTPKGAELKKNNALLYGLPHIFLIGLSIPALILSIRQMWLDQNPTNFIIVYWLGVNLYYLIMAVVFMMGRTNFRRTDRIFARVNASVGVDGDRHLGTTTDLSEGGASILFDKPWFLDPKESYDFEVEDREYRATFKGQVRHVSQTSRGWRYSIEQTDITEEAKGEYLQIVFDRDHGLAKSISTNFYQDFRSGLKNFNKGLSLSNRKLPRIPIQVEAAMAGGRDRVALLEYNYRNFLIRGLTGQLDRYELLIGEDLVAVRPTLRKGSLLVAEIEDWETWAKNKRFKKALGLDL